MDLARALPALAAPGYRAVAMDLRGYGGSDKTPNGYDPLTLAQDVAGVVKALGARSAVLVGHGWGGYVAWTAAPARAGGLRALRGLGAPPGGDAGRPAARRARLRHVLAMQLPWVPERRLADPASGFLADHLRTWSGPGSFPDVHAVATYQRAIGLWPASHCALEYHRWLFRSRLRADGRRFGRLMRPPVSQPVLSVTGAEDPALPAGRRRRSRAHVVGELTEQVLPGVGHFPHEEDPEAFTAALPAGSGGCSAALGAVAGVHVGGAGQPRAAAPATCSAVSA